MKKIISAVIVLSTAFAVLPATAQRVQDTGDQPRIQRVTLDELKNMDTSKEFWIPEHVYVVADPSTADPRVIAQQKWKQEKLKEITALVKQKNEQLAALAQQYPQAKEELEELQKAHFVFAKKSFTLSATTQEQYPYALVYLYDTYNRVAEKSAPAAEQAQEIINHLYVYQSNAVSDAAEIVDFFFEKSKKNPEIFFVYIWNQKTDLPLSTRFRDKTYFDELLKWYNALTCREDMQKLLQESVAHWAALHK